MSISRFPTRTLDSPISRELFPLWREMTETLLAVLSRLGFVRRGEHYCAAGVSRAALGRFKSTKSTWVAVEITECFWSFWSFLQG